MTYAYNHKYCSILSHHTIIIFLVIYNEFKTKATGFWKANLHCLFLVGPITCRRTLRDLNFVYDLPFIAQQFCSLCPCLWFTFHCSAVLLLVSFSQRAPNVGCFSVSSLVQRNTPRLMHIWREAFGTWASTWYLHLDEALLQNS